MFAKARICIKHHRTANAVVLQVATVAKLAAVVVATFAACWAPYLTSPAAALEVLQVGNDSPAAPQHDPRCAHVLCKERLKQMECLRAVVECSSNFHLQRLAPLKRGLYEDYVANFWCSTHFLLNWKRMFSQAALVRLCLGAFTNWQTGTYAQKVFDAHGSFTNPPVSIRDISIHLHACICQHQPEIYACTAAATLVGLLPAMLHQIQRPSNKVSNEPCAVSAVLPCIPRRHDDADCAALQGLLLCMSNCAMVFFMFSYQVCSGCMHCGLHIVPSSSRVDLTLLPTMLLLMRDLAGA
jgi:ALG6, ALG8 glycosyltransferase family